MKVLWTLLKLALKLAPIYQIVASLLTDFLKKLRDDRKWAITLELARKVARYIGEQLVLFADMLEDWTIDTEEVKQINDVRLEILEKYAEGKSAKEEKARLAQIELDKAAELKAARDAAKETNAE